MLREIEIKPAGGVPIAIGLSVGVLAGLYGFYVGARSDDFALAIPSVLFALVAGLLLPGLFTVEPNEGKALTLFGTYTGTVRQAGLWWVNPFMQKTSVSLRVRNFETNKLKVNDAHSNPVEIGAIVVWRVTDTAEALYEVNDYVQYVAVQSESALRALASQHPYDAHGSDAIALSTHQDEVNRGLAGALVDRLAKAGVEVIEARISHLAYSPEIAAAMLQRQQASAIVAARQTIVEGAVGMVELALAALKERDIVDLDGERKAAMVSNLLVVLCSERSTQPVVNTGSLYT
ncbi:MAG: SPFH domain-containing protein [Gemmatimonadaceae bacterium]|uniref:SPFH domain-containing protein n=1 Tax=Gemmatimonas sp. TaxID=1962908 RepID=UPI001D890613|nr:SPFH domain-containing protein [Gemmatimonas sp.]NCW46000.1 SPFH domain-containing protein [Gemmatimonadaceae bacterium]